MPKVTVLMPVYNSADHLEASIRSILSQTFKEFQFLIIDDGSTDNGQDIVRSFQDSRIQLIQNESNLGVAASLNKGIDLSTTEYIARMDADDVSSTTRLASQVEVMEREKNLDICGSWIKTIEDGGRGHVIRYPVEPTAIKAYLLYNNPLAHPVVMLRKSALVKHGLYYDEGIGAGQDYEFWARCAKLCCIKNIPKVLLSWRRHSKGVTRKDVCQSDSTALLVQKRELNSLGFSCDEKRLLQHREIGSAIGLKSEKELKEALLWLNTLVKANRERQQYEEEGFLQATAMVWFRLCMNSARKSRSVLKTYLAAPFFMRYAPCPTEVAMFTYSQVVTFFQKKH